MPSTLPPAPGSAAADAAAPAAPATPEIKLTMFLPIIVLMGWSKLEIDMSEGSDNLMYLRICFYTIATLCVCSVAYIRLTVSNLESKEDDEKITVTTPKSMGVEAKVEELTVKEHDMKEVSKLVMGTLMPIVIISFLHFKWQYERPLVMQSVMMPFTLSDNKLFKIYILGQQAVGKLARPWTAPASPFAALLGGGAAAPAPAALKSKKKDGKKKKSSRPSGETGVTEKSASEAKDTKKTK
jgi:hypothetical protein